MRDAVERVPIGVEAEEDRVTRAEIRVEVHHALLLAGIVRVTEFVDLDDDAVRSIVDEDIGAVLGTAVLDALVAAEREAVAKVRFDRIDDVVLLETETTGDGLVGMEHAVAVEAVGLPLGSADRDVLTVLAGDGGRTERAVVSLSIVDAPVRAVAFLTDRSLSVVLAYGPAAAWDTLVPDTLVLADPIAGTFDAPMTITTVLATIGATAVIASDAALSVIAGRRAFTGNAELSALFVLTILATITFTATSTDLAMLADRPSGLTDRTAVATAIMLTVIVWRALATMLLHLSVSAIARPFTDRASTTGLLVRTNSRATARDAVVRLLIVGAQRSLVLRLSR